MDKREWQENSLILKDLLNLELSPVAVSCVKEPLADYVPKKTRICKAILLAAKGEMLAVSRHNNSCFGAGLHMGLNGKPAKVSEMSKKIVVEGEKLFSSYQVLDSLMSQLDEPKDYSDCSFLFSAMEKAQVLPQLVLFLTNAEAVCRLLTLATFSEGVIPKIKIGGPTCRMSIIYPLQSEELNLSFFDYTSRKLCNLEKDKLLITIPYVKIPQIIKDIDLCSAGRAKMDMPQEFREFLRKKITSKQE